MSLFPRKCGLDDRLDAYFATLRPAALKQALKKSAGNWQFYAAVTSSAMAMVTSASTSMIVSGVRDIAADPVASARTAKLQFGSSKDLPLANAFRLAMARQAGANIAKASQTQAPSITAVVPLDGSTNVIQPGEWVSIFGSNLAGQTVSWNGTFPISLGSTSVEIDGKPAFLQFVSPGQINLQAPDDTARGLVSVVVTTPAGKATSTVTLSEFAPAFNLLDINHVSGIILRKNHTGAYGGGSYDILGPTGNAFGYPTIAAQPGDRVELFCSGLGPTTPAVPAGKTFSGAAPIDNSISIYINNVLVKPHFVGLSSAGLYQINLRVPTGLGEGDVPILAVIGSMKTQPGILFSLQSGTTVTTNTGTGVGFATGGFGFGFTGGGTVVTTGGTGGGMMGGTGGGGMGGTGGAGGTGGGGGGGTGSDIRHSRKPYHPKLQFPHS